jgi:1,5-anhydro-D-fructose reductase (1,5-anhydro-D-mannitol-forming)
MADQTVRWGIIGCGDVTEVKSGPAFQKARRSELVAVMRRNPALAEDYARRHGVSRWYHEVDALIADPEVDAVYIATPVGSHLEHALRVCAAGKPALVEKPMARNHTECRRMADAFHDARLPLFVAYYRRALPRFLLAKSLLGSGRLGRLVTVNYSFVDSRHRDPQTGDSPWRLAAEHSGGGLFFDLGCHTLDIIDFLCGNLEQCSGQAENRATPQIIVEDTIVMHFRTRDGVLGTASWNFAGGGPALDLIEITGTEGRLSLCTFGAQPLVLQTGSGREEFPVSNPPHIHQPFIQTVVDQLLGCGQCPGSGDNGSRIALAMDTAVENYYGDRKGDFWLNPENWPGRPR